MLLLGAMAAGCTAAPAAAGSQTVRGVLLEVHSPSLQRIDGFTLRTDAGREMVFVAAPDFNAGASHAMTPGHMRQHMALADPVMVTYRDENGTLMALTATDAVSS